MGARCEDGGLTPWVCVGPRLHLSPEGRRRVLRPGLGRAPHRGRSGGVPAALSGALSNTEGVCVTPSPKVCESPSLVSCAGLNRYLQADIEAFDIRELTPKFDVILLEPPLEEYYRETGIAAREKCWTWDDVGGALRRVTRAALPVGRAVSASPLSGGPPRRLP